MVRAEQEPHDIAQVLTVVTGLTREQVQDDPSLGAKCGQLVLESASKLQEARMITSDSSKNFTITDLGRIAAKYYIRHASIEIFNQLFKPRMSEADVLAMLCMSTEVSL